MESQHMTQQTFSDFIGISSASLSSIFNGRTKPTLNTVEAIRSKFTKINLEWLLYGNGQMFLDDAPLVNDSKVESPSSGTMEGILEFGQAPSYGSHTPQQLPVSSMPSGSGNSSSMHRMVDLKTFDKPKRSITEIRIFFDDQTWETFVPKKN